MAMFDNVTYDFYSDTLGRAVVPNEDSFNSYKLMNIQFMKKLLPFVEEREENGIDSAVCMMIEVDYLEELAKKDPSTIAAVASESVSGHSVSFVSSGLNKEAELNAKSTNEKKMTFIKLFCFIEPGV